MNEKYVTGPGEKKKHLNTGSDIRREHAWRTARVASDILRERFGASRVLVFGSLSRPSDFTRWSDIDLAAYGIPPNRFYRAVADVTGFSREFEIDLTDVGTCPRSLLKVVEKEGIEL